ncbi:hypothetical protein Ahy_A03g012857 [Arachis hypogaea]|uniref:Endonuclease/exonuclease/phosphatase domain-containing protein n=1 Tax=Arachis hypogaea TaxID=3818 RepID=A0A445DUB3_ARAHY|nr:hypothetical protein Ahy_A03g012857 [Arachis hypogaea]
MAILILAGGESNRGKTQQPIIIRFTWFSNPRNGCVTREKIDRALVNWECRVLFENASLLTMPAISSDHCLLFLDPKLVYRTSKSFKFETFWADHEECKNIVKKEWEKEVSQSCEWTRITRSMNNCKEELKKLELKEELKKLQDSDFAEEKRNGVQKRVDIEEILGMASWETPKKKNKALNAKSSDETKVSELIIEEDGWNKRKIVGMFPYKISKAIFKSLLVSYTK